MDNSAKIQTKIKARAGEKNILNCKAAHLLAQELDVEPLSLGQEATAMGVRITCCQLGFFGFAEKKGMPGYKIVRQLENVPQTAAAAVQEAAQESRISCAALWEIGQTLGIPRLEMGNIIETLNIKTNSCQLGCF